MSQSAAARGSSPLTSSPAASSPAARVGAPGIAGVTDRPRRAGISRHALGPMLMIAGIVAVGAGAVAFWVHGGRYVSVDDSYVRAAKEALSTDVSGVVADVPVKDGQTVEKGQVLLRLDPRRFQIAVAGAKADLARDRADAAGDAARLPSHAARHRGETGAGAGRSGQFRPLRHAGERRRRHPRGVRQCPLCAAARPVRGSSR